MATAFRKIYAGREGNTTVGTAVAADKAMLGTMTVSPQITMHQPTDERGSLSQYYRTEGVAHQTSMRYTSDATFEQVLDFLSMTLCAETTAASGAQTTYSFDPTLETANAQKGYTFEYGDDAQAWKIPGTQCTSLELGMSLGGPLTLSAELFGQFPVKTTFTSGITTDPAVKTIITDMGKFYMDDTFGNVGNTQKGDGTNEVMIAGGSIRLNSGLTPSRRLLSPAGAEGASMGAGSTVGIFNYNKVVQNRRSHSMDLDLIANSGWVSDVYDAYVAQTPKAIRLKFTAETDSIDTGKSHSLFIDMYGYFTSIGELYSDSDGDNMVRCTFTSYSDNTATPNEVRAAVVAKTSEVGTL